MYLHWSDPEGFGAFWVPSVEATIEVEVEDSIDYLLEEQIRYRCALYSDTNDIPIEFKTNYPRRKGFKFKSGIFMFDDTPGEFLVQLFHVMGHGFELTKDGDVNWNAVRDMTASIARNLVIEALAEVGIKGATKATLQSDVLAVVDAPLIKLTSGALEPMVLGTQLLTFFTLLGVWLNTHTHTGVTSGPGVTGPPGAISPPAPPTINSAKITGS